MLSLSVVVLSACSDYGATRVVEEEEFLQDGGNLTVDLLFVIDNSQTMTEEQDMVSTAMPTLVDALGDYHSDWQVAVVTTDVSEETAGQLVGGVFTAASSQEDISAAMSVGAEGDRTEQGLEAMRLATTDPNLSGSNAGFIRSEADLGVIFVSDEDDSSPDEVSVYAEHMDTLKGSGRARGAAIVGQLPAGCDSPTAAADPGTRYLDVAAATGGMTASICAGDFSTTMKQLALNAMGLNDTFPLAVVPELSTMEVWVDSTEIERADTDGWRYDAGDNAVILDGFAVPAPGATVLVRYYPWMGSGESEQTTGTSG